MSENHENTATGAVLEPGNAETRSYTTDDLNRVVAERLARAEKAHAKAITEARSAAIAEAKLSEAEQLANALSAAKAEQAALLAKLTLAERRAQLSGAVSDVSAAVKLADDSHLDEAGNIDLDALFRQYPSLKPTPAAATPTPGAGASQTQSSAPSLEAAIKSGDQNAVLAAFNAQLARGV
jgi:hypothetical protein